MSVSLILLLALGAVSVLVLLGFFIAFAFYWGKRHDGEG
jgi:hypothetical protein